jgi:hypothetical protein
VHDKQGQHEHEQDRVGEDDRLHELADCLVVQHDQDAL